VALRFCSCFIIVILIMASAVLQPGCCVNKVLGDDKPNYLCWANNPALVGLFSLCVGKVKVNQRAGKSLLVQIINDPDNT
jgi:hypothetical protein